METWDVMVVGAGMAGMTAAALLAHDGARVLLLEGHDKPGGCAGYFESNGFTFDTGATVLTGLEPGDPHQWTFDRLGVSPPVSPLPGLHVHLPDRDIRVAHDAALWRDERRRAFPAIADAAERFWRRQERVADAMWRMMARQPSLPLRGWRDAARTLRAAGPEHVLLAPFLHATMRDVLRRTPMDADAAFRAFLDMLLLITVQETADHAAFLNGCVGLDIYRHGVFRAQGGMKAVSDALLSAFRRDGGEVRFKSRVRSLQRRPAGGWDACTTKGHTCQARRVVANVPVWNLPGLLGNDTPEAAALRPALERAGEGWGAAVLYLGVEETALPPGAWPHHQVLQRPRAPHEDGNAVFLSLSLHQDPHSAPPGCRTLNVSTHTRVGPWFQGNRTAYLARKAALEQAMMDGVRQVFPHIDAGIRVRSLGTPPTWERFTMRAGGQVGGVRGRPDRVNLRALSRDVGLEGLWLVGDTTFPGQGTVACTLGGINAWKDIREAA